MSNLTQYNIRKTSAPIYILKIRGDIELYMIEFDIFQSMRPFMNGEVVMLLCLLWREKKKQPKIVN